MTDSRDPILPPGPPRPGSSAVVVSLSMLAFAYLFIGAFPGSVTPGSAHLDGGWVLEINRLPPGSFGRDLAFTYGPLGFLLYPATTASHVALALGLRAVTLAALSAWVFSRAKPVDKIVYALALVGAMRLGLTFEYQVLLPVMLLTARSLSGPPGAGLQSAAVAALAGAALFVKFSLGVALLAVVVTGWGIRLLRERGRSTRAIAVDALAGAVTVLVLSDLLLAHPLDLLPWLRRSVEMASGYSDAMSLASAAPGSLAFQVTAAASVLLLAGIGTWGTLHGSPGATLALLAAGPTFMAFKHAFVREDAWHTTLFFPFVLSVAAAAAILPSTLGARRLARAAVSATLVLSILVAISYGTVARPTALASGLTGVDGARALRTWFALGARPQALAEAAVAASPPRLAEVVAGRRVGVVPFLLGLCAIPGVDCTPNPTLQTFAAFTPGLDQWSAEHYLGARAPPLVMLHLDGIDGRSPALDTPALWRALVASYRAAPVQVGGALLLERITSPARPAPVELGKAFLQPGQWVTIPDLPGTRYVALDFDLTLAGKAQRFAFRVGPVLLSLRYPTGEVVTHRLVPATARDGLPVDQLPLSLVDLFTLFRGEQFQRPVALAVSGDGLPAYRSPIPVTWLASHADAR